MYLDSEKDLDAVRTFMEALNLTIPGTGNVPAQNCKTLTAAFSSRALDGMLRFARYQVIMARHAITSYWIRMRKHNILMLMADNENAIRTCRRGCVP